MSRKKYRSAYARCGCPITSYGCNHNTDTCELIEGNREKRIAAEETARQALFERMRKIQQEQLESHEEE